MRLTTLLLAALLLLPASVLAFGKNKIAYDDFDWKVYETTHFAIHHYGDNPDDLAKIASYAESAYEDLASRFNFQIDDKIPLVMYATHADFQQTNIILSFIPEGVGAFAEPARNRMVLPADLPDKALYELMVHELTHIFEYEILFQGKLRKAMFGGPPQWFMEGLASYMASDEDARDQMVIRDAVIHNLIPEITQKGIGGFFAYRFGHAAFRFIEEEFGDGAVRDFVFEFRSALGRSTGKAVERTFDIEPEEFDIRFRRWLRKRYLPDLVEHGEPIDFGRQVRLADKVGGSLFSAVPSPSGDLAAAFAIVNNRVDVVAFGTEDRKFVRNLTKGRKFGTEYPVVQFVTVGPVTGRDLAWSPDGDHLAYFARKERSRELLLINALDGDLVARYEIAPDEPLSPSFAPDGRSIVFRGFANARSDIYRLDLETGAISNLTDDADYQTSPMISPDGQWLYYSVVDEERWKIFRMKLGQPEVRQRVTDGDGSDEDLSFSADGGRIVYSSSREDGIYNIFSLDLDSGEIVQWTDAVGGSFVPWVLPPDDEGDDRLLFSGFYRGEFGAYVGKMNEPVAVIEPASESVAFALDEATLEPWYSAVEVPIDPARSEDYGRGRLFVDDANVGVGITSDQRFYSDAYLSWSDLLGNRRIVGRFASITSYTSYQLGYYDLSKRLQKGLTAWWYEDYYVYLVDTEFGLDIDREQIFRNTGVRALGSYPFDRYHRVEASLGYVFRKLNLPIIVRDTQGDQVLGLEPREDDYPELRVGLVGDTAEFKSFGPYRGYRWNLDAGWAADTEESGTLFWEGGLDFRGYLPLTQRSLFALRVVGKISDGETYNIFYFGGLDELRGGYDFREQVGNRMVHVNLEYRFPLVDRLRLPFMEFSNIRGRVFLDIGAAWLDEQDFRFWDSDEKRLRDGLAAWGWGFSWDAGGGLSLHWDFGQKWDLKDSIGDTQTTFWIGQSF